jgi:hypothetical protein
MKQSGSPAAVNTVVGALRASEGNDREAIVAWEAAVKAGADTALVSPLIVDALLRLGDAERAADLATRTLAAWPESPRAKRQLAAVHIATSRYADAVQLLDAHLRQDTSDVEAQWVALHALFAGFVAGSAPGATDTGRARIAELAAAYIAANGPHAALARDWAQAVASAASTRPPAPR